MRYHVMHQDDNGNIEIFGGTAKPACYRSPEGAECEKLRLESLGHKQTYWVEPTSVCTHE